MAHGSATTGLLIAFIIEHGNCRWQLGWAVVGQLGLTCCRVGEMLFDEYQGDEEIRFLFLRCHHQELERPVVLQYKYETDTVSVPEKDEILY
ncbi:hypothetical protein ZIOFF_065849 [Zingiber officinale]|uniref:Uncharacterized protein n=1 Tax=Zingiber officinale TaxID=94328 RepID=A0A8J5EXL4_ZINOF|nr:hypothetical protein ZIOFF_065849 [Zingiber officinale]